MALPVFNTLPIFLLTTPIVYSQARSRPSYPTCSGVFLVDFFSLTMLSAAETLLTYITGETHITSSSSTGIRIVGERERI